MAAKDQLSVLKEKIEKARWEDKSYVITTQDAINIKLALKDENNPTEPVQSLQKFMDDCNKWREVTFPGATPISHLIHLLKEVEELKSAIFHKHGKDEIHEEFADCFILLLNVASQCNLTINDLHQFAITKMDVNKKRKWCKPDKDGVVYHVKDQLTEPTKMMHYKTEKFDNNGKQYFDEYDAPVVVPMTDEDLLKNHAIEFAEWVSLQGWHFRKGIGNWNCIYKDENKTTEELYEMFINQREKP